MATAQVRIIQWAKGVVDIGPAAGRFASSLASLSLMSSVI